MREDWIELELGKVCFTTSGGTPSRKVPAYYEGDIPWVKSGELNHNVIRDTEEHISEEAVKNSSAKIFPEGTLLIALYGATIGKLAILGVPATTNQAVCGIYKNGLFETRFLFNYLFHKKQKLLEQGAGGAQPNISQTILKKLRLPIVPLPEQRAIVSKIEQLFSELDHGIANLQAAKDKLEIYRQAVLKKAFEGELTKEWRKNKKGDSVKKTWKSDNLKNRTTQITKGSTPTTYGYKYMANGVNFIKVENIKNGKVDLNTISQFISADAHEFQKRSQLKVNDILFSIAGTIGETVIIKKEHIPANTNQALAIIRGFEDSILPEYLLYLLRSFVALTVKSKARGGAMNNISLGDLKKLEILIPPKDEQEAILSEIESRLSVCDNILDNIEEGLEKSEALRQSILKQAFEGQLLSEEELEACKKEADWEPAEQLLERIKKRDKVKSKKLSDAG